MSKGNVTVVQIKDLIDQIKITSGALYEFSGLYPEDSEVYNLIYLISEKLNNQVENLYIDFIRLHGDQLVKC